jgi:hypothetical protein
MMEYLFGYRKIMEQRKREGEASGRVAGCRRAEEILRDFGIDDITKAIEIGNELNVGGRHQDAAYFFRRALQINPDSGHVRLRLLETFRGEASQDARERRCEGS